MLVYDRTKCVKVLRNLMCQLPHAFHLAGTLQRVKSTVTIIHIGLSPRKELGVIISRGNLYGLLKDAPDLGCNNLTHNALSYCYVNC